MASNTDERIQKLLTGIEGFDLVTNGGLPMGRSTLISGTAGSAKTVLAMQFLVEGAARRSYSAPRPHQNSV